MYTQLCAPLLQQCVWLLFILLVHSHLPGWRTSRRPDRLGSGRPAQLCSGPTCGERRASQRGPCPLQPRSLGHHWHWPRKPHVTRWREPGRQGSGGEPRQWSGKQRYAFDSHSKEMTDISRGVVVTGRHSCKIMTTHIFRSLFCNLDPSVKHLDRINNLKYL